MVFTGACECGIYRIWKLKCTMYKCIQCWKSFGIRYNGKSLSKHKVYSICQVNKFMGSEIWHIFCILHFLKEPNLSNPKFFHYFVFISLSLFLFIQFLWLLPVILHWIMHNCINSYRFIQSIYIFSLVLPPKLRWMKHLVPFFSDSFHFFHPIYSFAFP